MRPVELESQLARRPGQRGPLREDLERTSLIPNGQEIGSYFNRSTSASPSGGVETDNALRAAVADETKAAAGRPA